MARDARMLRMVGERGHTQPSGSLGAWAPRAEEGRCISGVPLFILAVALTLLVTHLSGAPTRAAIEASRQLPSRAIVVHTGDTLWSVARAHPVPGLDIRDTVQWIRERNGLGDSSLTSGQVIEVVDGSRIP